jgi:hypothetical protein
VQGKDFSFSWKWQEKPEGWDGAHIARAVSVEVDKKVTLLEPGTDEFLVWILRVGPPSSRLRLV